MESSRTAPASVDEYIEGFSPEVQEILQRVRQVVRESAPHAQEVISYRMPAVKQNGIVVYFAAFKSHIGLYPPVTGDLQIQKAIAPYAGEKGNLRFPFNQPIPYDLIARVTALRVKQDAAKSKSAGRKVLSDGPARIEETLSSDAQAPPAADPDSYVAALAGWQRASVEKLRAAVRATSPLVEVVKWGHLVYLSNGPVLLIRAEEERVLFGFWRGQRLRAIEDRLKPGGKYEMATLALRDGATISAAVVRRLTKEAVALNNSLGDPTQGARPNQV